MCSPIVGSLDGFRYGELPSICMCNRYTISATPDELTQLFDALASPEFEVTGSSLPGEVFPYSDSPGLLLNAEGRRELRPMQFSITPAWSKEQKVKYQTNNARIEDIEQKKTFSGPLKKYRCLVPLSSFREPCYWGEPAGKEVDFTPVADKLLYVAAIYTLWNNKTTMSFLMRPAGEYVMECGHHRQPLFLSEAGIEPWIGGGEREIGLSKQILQQFAYDPPLSYTVARSMVPAWKSRQQDHLAKRDEQLAAIDEHGPLGY